MFAIDERMVGKVGGQIVRGNVTLNVPLPLDNRAHISLSLSRFCPVFSPPPFHHPLVEPHRCFFPLLLLPLPLLLSARTIFIKPKGEK